MSGKRKSSLKYYRDQRRHVVLRVYGKDLDPDKITKALGIQPAWAGKRCTLKGKNGKIYRRPLGNWSIDSRLRRNATLQNQIKDIFEQIKSKKADMRRILKNASADLNIVLQPHEKIVLASRTFPAKIINEFTSLGIDITFTMYAPTMA